MLLDDIIKKSGKGIASGILYGKDYHTLLSSLMSDNYRRLIESFYSRIAGVEGRAKLDYWGEKHPHLNLCLDRLDEQFPDARYIYSVRDPRDSALSIAKMRSVSFEDALDNWSRFSRRYEEFARGKGPETVLVTRYEDMVRGYRAEADRIFAWLGMETSAEVVSFLETSKSIDAHSGGKARDFSAESVGRWTRTLTESQVSHAAAETGEFLEKYGYSHTGADSSDKNSARAPSFSSDTVVDYRCNICGSRNRSKIANLDRESKSCVKCGSSVRMRAIIHLLSQSLFGESLCISDFPLRKDIKGIGLSDWGIYAKRLEGRLGYTNTFYHQEPRVDVTEPDNSFVDSFDFLIASDVFEHVLPPVSRAFVGARRILRPGGALIFSVPFLNRGVETVEHFPKMKEADVVLENGSYRLHATNWDGTKTIHDELRFHGGPGSTLEMRIFTRSSLLEELRAAGFQSVKILDEPVAEWGIYWKVSWSLPLVALA